jgi:hypothetical protein
MDSAMSDMIEVIVHKTGGGETRHARASVTREEYEKALETTSELGLLDYLVSKCDKVLGGMSLQEADKRIALQEKVRRLALQNADSLAPRKKIAALLHDELIAAGIPKEDHFVFVANHIPEGL